MSLSVRHKLNEEVYNVKTTLQLIKLIYPFLLFILFLQCQRSTLESINEPVFGNHSPIISAIILSRDTISIRDTCLITCEACDPDLDSLEYVWECILFHVR